jgi:glycerophosphoryl diester phosphodiesterase
MLTTRLWKVAHRGASAELPENTLAAFERAIELGADVIEADVRQSSDGALLVLHDAELDRTTNGTGLLRDVTAAEARLLDAGEGERVPRVEEVLQLARGRVRVNLDLKEVEATVPAVAAVQQADMVDSVTYISFLPEVWEVLEELRPGSPVIHLVDSAAGLAGLAMGDPGSFTARAGFGIPFKLANPDLVDNLRRHGYGVFAWTVDDDAEMRRLIEAGVNGVVTNRIAALVEVERQLRAAERRTASARD